MPYIKPEDRKKFNLDSLNPESAGELNYIISELCGRYVHAKGLSYSVGNEVVGALECAKQEFYRRVLVPYEEIKMAENGDVIYRDISA